MDWKRKLTSRKFWAAVCGFVSMLIIALGKGAETAQTVTGLIMAGASLIGYIIGEGIADAGNKDSSTTTWASGYISTTGTPTTSSVTTYTSEEE